MKNYFSGLLLIFNFLTCLSQTETSQIQANNDTVHYIINMQRHAALITGGNFGGNNVFPELGFSIKDNGRVGHHPQTTIWMVSSEFGFVNQFVIGPKVGLWAGGGVAGMNMGLNLIYYSNFNHGTLRFRPEIGFGFNSFRVVYGYNFLVVNRRADFINKHMIGLNILINLKKIKDVRHGPINTSHED